MRPVSNDSPIQDSPPNSFFARWGASILGIVVLCIPLLLWGTGGAVSRFQNDVRQWLPRGFEEADRYAWYLDRFGVDEMVVISWDGCTITDPRIEQFSAKLVQGDAQGREVFRRVTTGPEMLERLMSPPFDLPREAAVARLSGTFIGQDGQTTALIAWGSQLVADNRRAAVTRVQDIAEQLGIPRKQLHLGGPTVDGAMIDIESRRLLLNQSLFSVTLLIIAAWVRLRRFWLVLCTIGMGLLAGALSLSVLYYSGGIMNLTMVMLPTLVFVLTVSGSIHVVNYFWHAVQDRAAAPAERAVLSGWVPCVLAVLTSMVGMLSLTVSRVQPIRQFGFYSGVGLLLSLPLILAVLPALLRKTWRRQGGSLQMKTPDRFPWLDPMVNWICLFHRGLTMVFLGLIVLGAIGLSWLHSTVKIQHRFAAQSKIIRDYTWLEKHLGPLVPLEIVVAFPQDDPRTEWDRFAVVRQIELAVDRSPDVLATFSAGTFRPVLPSGRTALATAQRSLIIDKWTANRQQRIDSGFVADDPQSGAELWHITARVNAINDIDYGRFAESLKHEVEQQLRAKNISYPPIYYTGGIPLIYKAQRQILIDLANSFGWAFGIITLTFMVILRSIPAGLIAMIPNIFPPAIVIGAMGWLNLPMDIGSVMTASVALGMAVDGTFHYLNWYRKQLAQGGSRRTATRSAMRQCARALFDSTVICALGVIPYAVTTFLPTFRFAVLLTLLMFVALIGDLVLFPAMLVGRWGAFFGGKNRKIGPRRRHDALGAHSS